MSDGDTQTQQSTVPQINVLPAPQPPSTAGMTEMGAQAPPQQPRMTFTATGVPALALAVIQAVKQRKQRELDKHMQNFVGLSAGRDEAQAQAQQADNMIRTAMPRIQANPHDQEARQVLVQASEMRKKAQAALQQNDQNLRDLANSPHGAKVLKALEKAAGLDDKQMNSPERQALIKAIQQKQNMDAQTAKIMSLMTQRQQLSPEARAQQAMVQGGVIGKPATGGQYLTAQSRAADRVLKGEKMANDVGLKTEQLIEAQRKQLGLVPVRDANGKVMRNPDGTMQTRNLRVDEMTAEEYAKYQDVRAQTELRNAQAKAAPVKARAQMLNAERMRSEKAKAAAPGFVDAWVKVLQDPTQKATIAQVPAAARGPVLAAIQAQGGKLAIPLSGDEIKRMDLATNAIHNIEKMQAILEKRPDMFGPSGWMGTKFEQALNGGDPDAMDFLAAKNLANLPAVGIHGVRGKWALQDLDKLDGNLYLNPESMTNVLNDIHDSAKQFQNIAGRPESIRGTSGPKRPANVPDNYVFRDGAKGKGWYKP